MIGAESVEHLTRDDDLLDFRCAFINAQRPDFAIEFFDLHALGDAKAAGELHRLVDDKLRLIGRKEFRHRRLTRDALLLNVFRPGGTVDEESGRIDVERHFCKLLLRYRKIGKRRAEHLAGKGARRRFIERASGEAERRSADGRTEDVER